MEKKVREARETKKDCKDDIATLTQHMHDMQASKEETDRQLSKMRKMYEEVYLRHLLCDLSEVFCIHFIKS